MWDGRKAEEVLSLPLSLSFGVSPNRPQPHRLFSPVFSLAVFLIYLLGNFLFSSFNGFLCIC